jgi:hypothetical protein
MQVLKTHIIRKSRKSIFKFRVFYANRETAERVVLGGTFVQIAEENIKRINYRLDSRLTFHGRTRISKECLHRYVGPFQLFNKQQHNK